MDKTLEDECGRTVANDLVWQRLYSAETLAAEKRRAVEMAIRRAAEVCATQEVFTGPKACAAAILKLLD
jgi:hypothetical protein